MSSPAEQSIAKTNSQTSDAAAYIAVILIWSTTPLAIKWSNGGFSPIAAVSARMLLALSVAIALCLLLRKSLPFRRENLRVYLAASLGVFPNMLLVYWAAQYVSSGQISVLFGLSPFFIGVFSIWVLKENPFSLLRIFAFCLAIIGLSVLFYDSFKINASALYGVLAMLCSNSLFALSSVTVKKLSQDVPPFEQTLGALAFAVPGFLLCWILLDRQIPATFTMQSLGAVVYLAVCGSLLGFLAFFSVVQRFSISTMSVIPLITPVLALILGHQLADEPLGFNTWLGTILVIMALLIYERSRARVTLQH